MPAVLLVVALKPLALHHRAILAAPRVSKVLQLTLAGRLVLAKLTEVTPCLFQPVIIERWLCSLRPRRC